jgi:hypothetical protein
VLNHAANKMLGTDRTGQRAEGPRATCPGCGASGPLIAVKAGCVVAGCRCGRLDRSAEPAAAPGDRRS